MAQFFKTNVLVSLRDIKILKVLYTEMNTFLQRKCEELLQCKSSSQFVCKNITVVDFKEPLTINCVKLTML